MGPLAHEILAGVFVVGTVIGLPWTVTRYDRSVAEHPGTRVIQLTGVKRDGVWTDEPVRGTNYWRKKFRPAVITLREGEEVVLRLNSADVTHGFYAPELGVGPVEVEPGHVVEVRVKGKRPGEFTYYCTAVCGQCHYFMRGVIRVLAADGTHAAAAETGVASCPHHRHAARPRKGIVARGAALFASKGCPACHGTEGRGGIRNPNYIRRTVPALNLVAERMMLYDPEEVRTVIGLLEQHVDLHSKAQAPPFASFGRALAQYDSIRSVIRRGNPAGKADMTGPEPPLHMPSWRNELSDQDIDAIIAFLLSEYPWEE